jgi:hypothetical protein
MPVLRISSIIKELSKKVLKGPNRITGVVTLVLEREIGENQKRNDHHLLMNKSGVIKLTDTVNLSPTNKCRSPYVPEPEALFQGFV